MSEKLSEFSANESALGYIYQIRYGLFLLLSDEGTEDKVLALESLDDISIEDVNQTNLNQTKYHLNRQANLTDRSPDFWKTMRVWCELIQDKKVDPSMTMFTLITSSYCSENSIMAIIKDRSEPIETIIHALDEIAKDQETVSKKHDNLKGYQAYSKLQNTDKAILLENMKIVDGSIDFKDIVKKIESKFILTTEPKKIPPLRQRLEGWWFNECITQLQAGGSAFISFKSLRLMINEIHEQLKRDNLPLDFVSPIELSEMDVLTYDQMVFVQQLKLIATGAKTLQNAISDYYRAFEQRGRWIREELLNPNEEDHYEQRLFEDWKAIFELMEDNLNGQVEPELSELGKLFYENYYVKRVPPIYIRENVKDSFLVRGSCHMLADRKLIGWHPHFKTKC